MENWWYAEGDERLGPFTLQEIQVRMQKGTLSADTLVWHEGAPEWKAAREFDGLSPDAIQNSQRSVDAAEPTSVFTTITDILNDAWKPLVARPGVFFAAGLISTIATYTGGILLFGFGSLLTFIPFGYGLQRMALAYAEKEAVDFKRLFVAFSDFKLLMNTFLFGIVMGLFFFIGGMLLVIPGLIAYGVYLPTLIYLDASKGFWAAMEESRKACWDNLLFWTVLGTVCLLIDVLGNLTIVGSIVTDPFIATITTVAFYRIILKREPPCHVTDAR